MFLFPDSASLSSAPNSTARLGLDISEDSETESFLDTLDFLQFVGAEETGISSWSVRSSPFSTVAIAPATLEPGVGVDGSDIQEIVSKADQAPRRAAVTGERVAQPGPGDPMLAEAAKVALRDVEAAAQPLRAGTDAERVGRRPALGTQADGNRSTETALRNEMTVDPDAEGPLRRTASDRGAELPVVSRLSRPEGGSKASAEPSGADRREVLRDRFAAKDAITSKLVEPKVAPDVARSSGAADVRPTEAMDRPRLADAELVGARLAPSEHGEAKREAQGLRAEMQKPVAQGGREPVAAGALDVGLGGLIASRPIAARFGTDAVWPPPVPGGLKIETPVSYVAGRDIDTAQIIADHAGQAEETNPRRRETAVGRDGVPQPSAKPASEVEGVVDTLQTRVRFTSQRAEVAGEAARNMEAPGDRRPTLTPVPVERPVERSHAGVQRDAAMLPRPDGSGRAALGRLETDVKPIAFDAVGSAQSFVQGGEELGVSRAISSASDIRPLAMPAPAAPPSSALDRVIAGFATEIASNAPGEVELTLTPKELGTLRFRMAIHEATLFVHVTADRPETTDLVRRHMALLTSELTGEGFADVDFSFGEDRRPSHSTPEDLTAGLAPTVTDTADKPERAPSAPTRALDLRI